MRYYLLLPALLLLLGSADIKAQPARAIPFTLLESGHIIVQAAFNGVKGNFIFDTGGGHNLLFDNFAAKLDRAETVNFFTAHRATGEALTVPIYYADTMTIGDLTLHNQLYSTFDMSLEGIDGLISLQSFEHTPVTIDFEHQVISFDKPAEAEKKHYIDIQIADYAGKALDIFTNVRLNDRVVVQVLLDSGAGNNSFWFNARLMDILDLDKSAFERTTKQSEFDPAKSNVFYRGKLPAMQTENGYGKSENLTALFVEGMIYEGKTGIDWLGKKIIISIPEKRIYLLGDEKY